MSALFRLLNIDPYDKEKKQKLDNHADAIIQEAQQNPHELSTKYRFSGGCSIPGSGCYCTPLHQAILLEANYNVILALYTEYAAKDFRTDKYHVFTSLLRDNAPLGVISSFLEKWPQFMYEQDYDGYTPLHFACETRASLEMISLLLKTWPNGIKKRTKVKYYRPLHVACAANAPLEVISLLLEKWPQAIVKKDHLGNTPLHAACQKNQSSDVIVFLFEKWPRAIRKKNSSGKTPLDHCQSLGQIESSKALAYISQLYGDEIDDNTSADEIMRFFIHIKWKLGVFLVLNRHPSLVANELDIDTNALPDFLSWVSYHCKLKTMWCIIKNKQDILAGI